MKEIESDEALWETKNRKRAEKEQRRLVQKAAEEREAQNRGENMPAEQAQSSARRPGFY